MAVVAGLVTGVELVMSRYWPRLRADLGIFVPLMAANCMVMGSLGGLDGQGRAATALVGLGRGIGFAVALTVLSFLREVAGSGTLWGRHVFGQAVAGVPFAALPAGAFVTAGFLAGLVGLLQARRARRT
jgi:electron transport complex protein RnfE